jgi:hypothetical protein
MGMACHFERQAELIFACNFSSMQAIENNKIELCDKNMTKVIPAHQMLFGSIYGGKLGLACGVLSSGGNPSLKSKEPFGCTFGICGI